MNLHVRYKALIRICSGNRSVKNEMSKTIQIIQENAYHKVLRKSKNLFHNAIDRGVRI